MRDPAAYLREGRNDPRHPQQLREHPYDFVALPPRPGRGDGVAHDRVPEDRLGGWLTFTYTTVAPLHVGSGLFETAAECGLDGGDEPVRGIARSRGLPVLPGSSWKGAVRSRFEAVTRSTLCLADRGGRERKERLPGPLRGDRPKTNLEIRDPRLAALRSPLVSNDGSPDQRRRRIEALSPADALFGALGYRGRVLPRDARIEGPPAVAPLTVAPLDSPALHRVARPGAARLVGGKIEIAEVEGRKFYYDGDLLKARRIERGGGTVEISERIDHVPAGCRIEVAVRVEAVTAAELGALLVAAGYGDGAGVLRFGGYKPAGLGKVELAGVAGELFTGAGGRSWRRPQPAPFTPEDWVAEARKAMLDAGALAELHAVTTTRRPPP